MSPEQKADLTYVFGDLKNSGNLDFVTPWYKKSADMMDRNPAIHTALVSTNSIVQGDQAGILGEYLFARSFVINFAYRTFKWTNSAKGKAAVHCVIVGFSKGGYSRKPKKIFDGTGEQIVSQINQYLLDTEIVIIKNRSKPICNVPEIGIGNQPIDGGNYLFTKIERDAFIQEEPRSAPYFRKWFGAEEFINNRPRYCLLVSEIPINELRQMPKVLERVENVRTYRLSSKRKNTIKLARTPLAFQTTVIPKSDFIVIPEVSSENRAYIPMGFLPPTYLSSNRLKIMPNSTLYHFGVLTSSTHMAWMRVTAGRLEMRYVYSVGIVYNNFPWPEKTAESVARIEKAAQAILDVRSLYPEASLADLYDELTMPPDLRKAHQILDKEVFSAYGKDSASWPTESAIVADLMKLYQKMTN
jgi:hypothetical protein